MKYYITSNLQANSVLVHQTQLQTLTRALLS